MKTFRNKVVVITGAASGMGRAYAEAFAREGALLGLNDWDAEGLEVTRQKAVALGAPKVYAEAFDVSVRDDMFAFADHVRDELGGCHVIINNAGIEGLNLPFAELPEDAFEKVINVNMWGVIHGTRAFLPQLLENNEGAVVNISSIFGLIGPPQVSDYVTAKFAVRGFTESLMVELLETPITVHVVHPGGIATNITRNERSQAFSKKYLTTPPEDIAQVVLKGIKRGTPRIVYGNGSTIARIGEKLVPQRILNHILRWEMKDVL